MDLKNLFDAARRAQGGDGESSHTLKEASAVVGVSVPRLSMFLDDRRSDLLNETSREAFIMYTVDGLTNLAMALLPGGSREKVASSVRTAVIRAYSRKVQAKQGV